MKKGKIIEAFRLLNRIKMNVVVDKETRAAIISNHLQMYKIAQAHDEEVKTVYEKMFEGKEADMKKVAELRIEYRMSTDVEKQAGIVKELSENYSHIFELERELNEIFAKKADEDIDINLIKFDKEHFINACIDSGLEVSMSDIIKLEEIFKD